MRTSRSRTSLRISLATAVLVGTATLFVVPPVPAGDPASELAKVDEALKAVPEVISLYTYTLYATAPPEPRNPDRRLVTISSPMGAELFLEVANTDRAAERATQAYLRERIEEVREALGGRTVVVFSAREAWNEIKPTWATLSWENARIAKARAMLYFSGDEDPSVSHSYEGIISSDVWSHRFELAGRPWVVEETTTYRLRQATNALVGGLTAFLVTLFATVFLAWAWTFLLGRIRELSHAIRGYE